MSGRPLTFTYVPNKTDPGQLVTGTWDWWCQNYFSSFAVREIRGLESMDAKALKDAFDYAKNGPAVILGAAVGGKKDFNMQCVDALELDIEHCTEEQIVQVMNLLQDYHYVLHSTYKHGSVLADGGKSRVRFIVPLDKPYAPVLKPEFEKIWHRFNAMIGGFNDPTTKNPARLNFLPSTWSNDPSLRILFVNPGRDYLSIEDLPVEIALPRAASVLPSYAASPEDDDTMLRKIRQRIVHSSSKVLEPELYIPLQRLIKGDALALDDFGWHNTVLKVTMWIALKEKNLSETALHQLFEKSIETMIAIDPSWDGWKEVEGTYATAVAKVQASAAPPGLQGFAPYTPEDVGYIAQEQQCSVEDLRRRWIIQNHATYFILGPSGGYTTASDKEARGLAVELLARAPVVLNEPTQAGTRRRPINELVEDYGHICKRVVADLTLERSVFDARENIMREAVCPKRVLPHEAQEDPEITEWLRLFAGNEEDHKTLLDWLATFPDLTRLTAALYIKGEPSTGKGLLIKGLARFWNQGTPTPLRGIFRSFNESVIQNPLIVADEALSVPRNLDPVAQIQSLIGSANHELQAKYKTWGTITGAVRVILAANNDDLLRAKSATAEERRAITMRVVVLQPPQAAADYLTSLGGFTVLNQRWTNVDRIAKHVLHLAATREVVGDRFAVAGKESRHTRDIFETDWERWCLEWIARFCRNPAQAESNPETRDYVKAESGALLVNANALKGTWKTYLGLDFRQEADLNQIGKALSTLGGKRTQCAHGGKRFWYYPIPIERIIEFADKHGICDAETIHRVVNRPPKPVLVRAGDGGGSGTGGAA